MLNKNVEIRDSKCIARLSGDIVCGKVITGKVVKVNAKSIRVHMTHKKCTRNGEVSLECEMDEIATFTFWRTTENRQFGKNAGKNVSFYKNTTYGVIEIVNN